MSNRYVEAARRARERELHLERLAAIELRGRSKHQPSERAGAGPARPWMERPGAMAAAAVASRRPPCAKGAPPARDSNRPRSAAPSVRRPTSDLAAQEHQRNVAALFSRLQKIERGDEWRQREHFERAMSAGRAHHTTSSARRQSQRALAQDNEVHMRRLRCTQARLASPSELALLTGKPAKGSGGGGPALATGGDDDE